MFGQQYVIQKGLDKFGDSAKTGAMKELDQLHKRNCFTPINVKDMSPNEKAKAQNGIMLVTEKRDKSVKGWLVYDRSKTPDWVSWEEAASPTVSLESLFLTSVINAKENWDVMTCNIPNAFIQAHMPKTKAGDEQVVMKITGMMVDLLVQLSPNTYGQHVVFECRTKVIYLHVLQALYGMLVAAILWYQKLQKDLESIGFKINPYNPCVANQMVRGRQHTVVFHVDNLKCSHTDKKVNSEFLQWLNKMYGEYGEVKAT